MTAATAPIALLLAGPIAFFAAALPTAAPADSPAVCLPAGPAPGLGSPDPFRAPEPKATELNAAGKVLYRQGKWEEARVQYRAALAADAAFLAPRLNVACSFVRQERFAEATAEVRALLDRAYVPWAREILEAADLGALKVRPEMAEIKSAMAASAGRWGEGTDGAVLFVARQRTPLRVPETGAGVFILNPHQEVYAFSVETGLYRQLTAADGRVLAAASTPDRRRITYVTAEKLVRGAQPADLALRGVELGELNLASMALQPPVRIDGDVRRLEVVATPRGLAYRIEGTALNGLFMRRETQGQSPFEIQSDAQAGKGALVPVPERPGNRRRGAPPLAVLTPRGAATGEPRSAGATCRATVREAVSAEGTRTLIVTVRGRPPRRLGERYGAGLVGLPIP